MNIMMVGHARAGKTAFMAAMYKYLGEDNSGYGIHAEDAQQRASLSRLASNLTKGIYPGETDIQSQYKFSFTVNGTDVMPFNWMDYRGGLLQMQNPTDKEKEVFLSALKYADALIVFLDGEKLSDPSDKWNSEYNVLISCIQCAIREKNDHLYPICFVITKCDLSGDTFYGLKHFAPLFGQIESVNHVEAVVLQSIVDKEHFVYPFLALSYCIYRGLPSYSKRRLAALEDAKERLESHRPSSILGYIGAGLEEIIQAGFSVFDAGWSTELDLANMAADDINREYNKLNLLSEVHKDLEEKIKEWIRKEILQYY